MGIKQKLARLARRATGFYEIKNDVAKNAALLATNAARLEVVERQLVSIDRKLPRLSADIDLDKEVLPPTQSELRASIGSAGTLLPETLKEELIREKFWSSGIFVIGHARSGTGILQMALNSSPDIYMLGESNLHFNVDKPGFVPWYHEMHGGYRAIPSKSTTLPLLADPEATGWDVLLMLKNRYRFVGDKVAYRSRKLGYDFDKSYNFLRRYFGGSWFFCTLRHPRDVIWSNNAMFLPDQIDDYIVSYLECLAHQIDIYFTCENVFFLPLDNIGSDTFKRIGERMNCNFDHAHKFYDQSVQKRSHPVVQAVDSVLLMQAINSFERVCALFESSDLECSNRHELLKLRLNLASILDAFYSAEAVLAEQSTNA
jgi:hypothetical protein